MILLETSPKKQSHSKSKQRASYGIKSGRIMSFMLLRPLQLTSIQKYLDPRAINFKTQFDSLLGRFYFSSE